MRSFHLVLLALVATAFGHQEATPKPKLLQNHLPISRLSNSEGETEVFLIVVPAQAANLTVRTRRGTGDVDLFVRHGAHPTPLHYDDLSDNFGTGEVVNIAVPEAGNWYVRLDAMTDFSGVELTASYELARGAVAPPLLLPGPGIYAERAVVRLRSPVRGAKIRYTLDGSEPGETSPIYSRRLLFTADTRVRAKVFNRNGVEGPEADGFYAVRPSGTVTTITKSEPLHHLAGVRGTSHIFKMVVPAGQRQLVVLTEGGPGDAQLWLRHAESPTAREFDARNRRRGNKASVIVENPTPGEWFIRLASYRTFSGVSLSAYTRSAGVDFIMWQPTLSPYVNVETFTQSDCEVQEGMITAGTHRLLRFSTETRNIGASDLVMPDPADNPDFEYASCHGHYHFLGFSSSRLLDSSGQEAALGNKVSFCLLDLVRWDDKAAPDARYTCAEQGIQSGWGDIYDSGLPGQWISLEGVAPGTYTLEVTINPLQILAEDDYTNNSARIQVVIDAP